MKPRTKRLSKKAPTPHLLSPVGKVSAGRAYIGLGSNLGNKRNNLSKAIRRLNQLPETRVLKQSSFYETAPEGVTNQPDFLNAVVLLETSLQPVYLLKQLLSIEADLGRKRRKPWGPRIIDLDILFYNDEVIKQPNLMVPHPRLHQRRFVLEPLAEIAPDLVHPILKRPIHDLLER